MSGAAACLSAGAEEVLPASLACNSSSTYPSSTSPPLGYSLSPPSSPKDVATLTFRITWRGSLLTPPIRALATETIADLKRKIELETAVPSDRQRFLGLVRGRVPEDGAALGVVLAVADPAPVLPTEAERVYAFMLMGTPDSELLRDKLHDEGGDVLDDMDFDYCYDGGHDAGWSTAADDAAFNLAQQKGDQESLDKACAKMAGRITPIHAPREGKKLLVLDLDYTLFDCKSTPDVFSHLIRPGTHEFLTALYPHYDLVIWSQTSWRWLEAKITEMGLLSPSRPYRITFVVDKEAMFKVTRRRPRRTEPHQHHVKPLQVIWSAFPMYHAGNTVHVDDLGRNFALNPQCGLKIPPFKNAPVSRLTDRELLPLLRYLLDIAPLPDLRGLNHKVGDPFLE